ncbi:uncharacterized protein ACRADG_004607 [Cochliomyia hominivorax]
MNKELQSIVYLVIVLFLVTATNAKGGRSSSGRRSSSSRKSNGRRGSSSRITSSGSGSSDYQRDYNGGRYKNNWFHSFFYNAPYRLTHRIPYIRNNHLSVDTYSEPLDERIILNPDEDKFVAAFSISRALNGDFLSIFNAAHNIAKYPEKIKNREFFTATTTRTPVTTPKVIKSTPITPSPTIYSFPIPEDDFFKWMDSLRTKNKKPKGLYYTK